MKIAACSMGGSLDSAIDPRFGMGAFCIIVGIDTLESVSVQNPGASNAQGAGIQAAQHTASNGVSAVIAGNFGH